MTLRWVVTVDAPPIVADFSSTGGLGPPLVIDRTAGIGYYLAKGNQVLPLKSGLSVYPETFGAIGYTTAAAAKAGTDNRAALQAAINAVVAVGGANKVPVICDGTNWRIG